ncbi:MAG: cupin domain-containing protein [Myxococcales bacterium]|nr:cupin domain-containing protein [Myxococcales bacterium]
MTVDPGRLALCALDLAEPDDATDREEVAGLRAAACALALALPDQPPPAHVRARLLGSVAAGPLAGFVARVAALYDLTLERAGEILGWVDEPSQWHAPMPGMQFAIFKGGPRHATADCGLLRIAPGATFPWHAHLSEEHSLFLSGSGRDHAGHVYVPGDTLVLPAGSAHDFVTISATELVIAVRHAGVDFAARRPPA